MAKGKDLLTVNEVKSAPSGAALRDGGGLYYRASGQGVGRWVYRFKLPGQKQREMGLGAFPAVSLKIAREKAEEARAHTVRGADPIEEAAKSAKARRLAAEADANAPTLGTYADEHFLPTVLPAFSNAAHIQQWEATFRTHLAPLRSRKLDEISREDILKILRPLWTAKFVTAARVRERLERLYSHAIQNGYFRGDNPAAWRQFDQTLIRPKAMKRGHHASIPHVEIASFVSALRLRQADSVAALMLEFIALAACRTGEARFAVWSEIDLQRAVWAIPKERMKMKRPHVVPLTPRMIEILYEARGRYVEEPASDAFVFPGPKAGKHLSEMAALMLMKRMGYGAFTAHGLRATFKSWATTETEFARELIEEQLAHQLGAVEAAYYRTSAIERRRVMMMAWQQHLEGSSQVGGQVLPFKVPAGQSA